MALPRYNGVVQDELGNLVAGASILVQREVSGLPSVQVYSDDAGATGLGSPFVTVDGRFGFYVAEGKYRITATFGGQSYPLKDVQIGPASPTLNTFGPETEITGATYLVGTTETFLTIKRTGPTLTEITLPPVADRAALAFAFADWSSSIVSDHEIRFIADGSETIMKAATFSVWSNASGLARGWVYPAEDLSGWVIT